MSIFRETFVGEDGNVVYGPDQELADGPFDHPGVGTYVELDDGWYRLRRVARRGTGYVSRHGDEEEHGQEGPGEGEGRAGGRGD